MTLGINNICVCFATHTNGPQSLSSFPNHRSECLADLALLRSYYYYYYFDMVDGILKDRRRDIARS